MRTQWNDAAIRKMCREKVRQIFKSTAHDTIKGRTISMKERCILEAHRGKRNRGGVKDLPFCIEIAIGMKVMVTNNIQTSQTVLVAKLSTLSLIETNLQSTQMET